jgi:hypothetical protein
MRRVIVSVGFGNSSSKEKSVRVPRDDPSREEEFKASQEIIPLERKSVRVPSVRLPLQPTTPH